MADLADLGFRVDTSGLSRGERALDSFSRKGTSTERTLKRAAAGVAAAITSIATSNKLIDVARQFDILNAQLITATGSSENAAKAFTAIQDFASKTPYDLGQVTDSFTKLVNLGLNPSASALTSYGNTAAAMGKDLNQMIEAVADAATGEFERLKEFGIKASSQGDKVAFTFRGMTTTIGKNAEEIESYLTKLGENEFAGAMANRIDTLDGKLSNLGDSWDKLFLNVSQSGIGDAIKDSTVDAITALDELSDFIVSGQLSASFDMVGGKFDTTAEDVARSIDFISNLIFDSTKAWGADISKLPEFLSQSFAEFPENIRAAMQIFGVELAALPSIGRVYFSAFVDTAGVEFDRLVDEAIVTGKAVADAMNPFGGDFDYTGEMAKITTATADATQKINDDADAKAEMLGDIRTKQIKGILDERNEAVKSAEVQITAIKELGSAYDKLVADRKKQGDVLGEFGIKKPTTGVKDKTGKDTFSDTIDGIESIGRAWDSTAGDALSAIGSIMNATDQYSAKMEELGSAGGGFGGFLAGAGLLFTAGSLINGLFGGSGGESLADMQARQSVGTVFGDSSAKSGSIKAFADIQSEQLSELIELNRSFFGLEQAITGVTKASFNGGITTPSVRGTEYNSGLRVLEQALSADGFLAESFSKTMEYKGRAVWKDREATSGVSASVSDQLDTIFREIGDSTKESAQLLGFDIGRAVDAYIIPAFDISTKGMNAEEAQQAYTDAFSAQADLLTKAVLSTDFIQSWAEPLEAPFETLNRLATEQAQYTNSIVMMGMALGDAFNIDEAQGVIAFAGGISEFNSLAKDFQTDFLSSAEQLDFAGTGIIKTLNELGYGGLDLTNEAFKGLVQSIDRTTTEGQQLYVELLQLAPAFADFTKETSALNNERLSLEADLLDAQAASLIAQGEAIEAEKKSTEALSIRRKLEVDAMDSTLVAIQKQVWAEQDKQEAISKSNAETAKQTAAIEAQRREQESLLSGIVSNIRGVLGQDKVSLADALSAAKAGDFTAAKGLNVSSFTKLSEAGFKSAQEMQLQQAINRSQLNEIANLAEGRLTDTQKQTNILAEINTGIEALVDASNPTTSGGFVGNTTTTDSESSELKEMLEMIMNSTASTAKWTSQTASNTQKILYDGIPVEIEA